MTDRAALVEHASGEKTETPAEHYDVLIVGAGLSGIGAAYHLQANCPGRTSAILEGREAIGGTWDLFRYPGIVDRPQGDRRRAVHPALRA
jgi:cation diffusion facilitator CzcD-associated flavoprotein CzcO